MRLLWIKPGQKGLLSSEFLNWIKIKLCRRWIPCNFQLKFIPTLIYHWLSDMHNKLAKKYAFKTNKRQPLTKSSKNCRKHSSKQIFSTLNHNIGLSWLAFSCLSHKTMSFLPKIRAFTILVGILGLSHATKITKLIDTRSFSAESHFNCPNILFRWTSSEYFGRTRFSYGSFAARKWKSLWQKTV